MKEYVLVVLIFMSSLYVYVSLRKYLLSMLLSLEFMMLGLFLFFSIYLIMYFIEMYLLMMFLVFIVCEGSLGLSILVSMIRSHGNNYFQSFSILMC